MHSECTLDNIGCPSEKAGSFINICPNSWSSSTGLAFRTHFSNHLSPRPNKWLLSLKGVKMFYGSAQNHLAIWLSAPSSPPSYSPCLQDRNAFAHCGTLTWDLACWGTLGKQCNLALEPRVTRTASSGQVLGGGKHVGCMLSSSLSSVLFSFLNGAMSRSHVGWMTSQLGCSLAAHRRAEAEKMEGQQVSPPPTGILPSSYELP